MSEHDVLAVDARAAAGRGLSEEAAEARHDTRPSQAALGALAARGCLRLVARVSVEDGLGPQATANALCAAAMQALGGALAGHGRLLYRDAGGVVRASRVARHDVDPEPVATVRALVALAA